MHTHRTKDIKRESEREATTEERERERESSYEGKERKRAATVKNQMGDGGLKRDIYTDIFASEVGITEK